MEKDQIVKHFTKFIYPFRYSAGASDLSRVKIVNAKGKESFPFKMFGQRSENLRKGIAELLMPDGGTAKIADCFELDYDSRSCFGLPQRKTEFMSFYSRKDSGKAYGVAITDVRIYLFESEVGFIDIECQYKSRDIKDFVDGNYFICEIKSEDNLFDYERRTGKDESEKISFTMYGLIEKLLKYVDGVKDIKKDCFPEFKEDKGIIYSYLLTGSKPVDLEKLLFTLRRNYKDTYKVPYDNDISDDPYIKRQFENSYWTMSFNGAVNLSYLTGDEVTDSFFADNFYSKLHGTYFSLFLHVLHQRFAMMKYMGDMGQLDTLCNDYYIMKKELKAAEDYNAKAARLKYRAFFKLPSSVEHVNDYFNLLYRTFRVNELKQSFSNDIEALTDICKTYVERIKARDDKIASKRKKKIEIFVSSLGTLVAVGTLLDSYWGLLEKLMGNRVDFWSAQILVFLGALLVPVVTVIVDVVYRIKEICKITNDLKDELKENLVEPDNVRKKRKKLIK